MKIPAAKIPAVRNPAVKAAATGGTEARVLPYADAAPLLGDMCS